MFILDEGDWKDDTGKIYSAITGGDVPELNDTPGTQAQHSNNLFVFHKPEETVPDQVSFDMMNSFSRPWAKSMSMSHTGDIVAIAPQNSQAGVYNTSNDSKIGDYLTGKAISLNGSGSRVAVGDPTDNENSGIVKIYDLNSGGTEWVQIGSDITGVVNSELGFSVALNETGNTVVIGCPMSNIALSQYANGQVRVYELSNNEWEPLGNNIEGQL